MYDFCDLNYPVDFLCYTPEEFNKLKKEVSIVSEALKEGIEIESLLFKFKTGKNIKSFRVMLVWQEKLKCLVNMKL
jgi:hypothetical protein